MQTLDPVAWAILLMAAGCALVVLEVFIPSGGILAFLSAAAFIGAIAVAFYYGDATTGMTFLLSTVVAVPILVALAFKLWPMTPMGKAFIGELPDEDRVSPEDPRRTLIGRVGVARSKMLPSGAVEIDDRLVDAISQGMAIDPDQYVVVTEVRGNRVVVRPANDDERPDRSGSDDLLSRPIEELGIESLDEPLA